MEWNRKSWREKEPPERHATNRISLREMMPLDFLSAANKLLVPVISRVAITPYADRLRALQEAERIHEMMSTAAYAMQKEVPGEILSVVDRLWFGDQRLPGPFLESRPKTLLRLKGAGNWLWLSVTGVTLYSGGSSVSFVVSGIRFRKDGTLGKLQETLNLSFTDERQAQ